MSASPLVKMFLVFPKLMAAIHDFGIDAVRSFVRSSVASVKAGCSLLSRVFLNFCLQILKLDKIQRLLAFDLQKRQKNPADVGSVFCRRSPFLLWAMFGSILVDAPQRDVVAAEGLVEETDGFGFTHLHAHQRPIGGTFTALVNSNCALSIDDAGGVCAVGRTRLLEGRQFGDIALAFCFALACLPLLSAFFAGCAWRMIKAGHLISFTDRWFGLMRCANTASAFSYCTPDVVAVAL